jgi:DNA-binding transcriptional MerR regulator
MAERVFTTTEAAKAAHISYRQLDTWIRAGVIEPEVRQGKGTGNTRLFSFNNIVGLHLASMARVVGCSLDDLKEIVRLVSEEMTFDIDGQYDDVFIIARDGEFFLVEGAEAVNEFVWRKGRFAGMGKGAGIYISIGDTVKMVKEELKLGEPEEVRPRQEKQQRPA